MPSPEIDARFKFQNSEKKIMKNSIFLSSAMFCLAFSGVAQAHGDFKCDVPKTEWKPQIELQRKLTSEGWKVL